MQNWAAPGTYGQCSLRDWGGHASGGGWLLGSAEEWVLSNSGGQILGHSLGSEHITPGCM